MCDKRLYTAFMKYLETVANHGPAAKFYTVGTIVEYVRSFINGAHRELLKRSNANHTAMSDNATSFFRVLDPKLSSGAGNWLQLAEMNLRQRDNAEKLNQGKIPAQVESSDPIYPVQIHDITGKCSRVGAHLVWDVHWNDQRFS